MEKDHPSANQKRMGFLCGYQTKSKENDQGWGEMLHTDYIEQC